MKILIVTGGFFPGVKCGGPPVSVNNFCTLMRDDECYVVAKNHDMGESEPYKNIHSGWNDRGNCKVKYLSDSEYGMKGFADAMDEISPDVLYLQSLFADCIIPCLALAKKRNIPVLLAPRGELCPGAMKKKYKKLPYILFLRMSGLARNVSFQSTSEDELEGIKKYFGDNARCYSLTNVPSMPSEIFSHPEKKAGEARLVFLSRIVPKKNLRKAIDTLAGVKGHVCLDIYGPIEDADYYGTCLSAADELPSTVKVAYKGAVGQGDAARVFAGYDAFVFPTKSENYGHVIAEALSAGCPVIVSDQTPWTFEEYPDAGSALPLDSFDSWAEAIQDIVDSDASRMGPMRRAATEYFYSTARFEELRNNYTRALFQIKEKA
mgnify:CR=1 FL=1